MGQLWNEVKNALGFGAKSSCGRQPAGNAISGCSPQQGATAPEAAGAERSLLTPTQPAEHETFGLLNAQKHVFGPRPAVRTPPPVFDGILNEDLHEWRTFKTGVLNAGCYQWSLPGILNATKHGWRKRPVH